MANSAALECPTPSSTAFSHNSGIGYSGNPAVSGTPGGGSVATIYNDGNTFDLKLCGTAIHDNSAYADETAIFFVSNDETGTLQIENSAL